MNVKTLIIGIVLLLLCIGSIVYNEQHDQKEKFHDSYEIAIRTKDNYTFIKHIEIMFKNSNYKFGKYLTAIKDKFITDKYNLTDAQNDLIYRVSRHSSTYGSNDSICLLGALSLIIGIGCFILAPQDIF